MSSNKTANLGLHLWEPEDDFLRTEFNENSQRIDAAAIHTHAPASIGAAAADHTHAPASIGAAAAGHTHTPAAIGAAAAGHTHTLAALGAAAAGHTHTPASLGAASAAELAALAALNNAALLDVTTTAAASTVSLDVSKIDFTAYLELTLYVVGAPVKSGTGDAISLRCNSLTTGYAWRAWYTAGGVSDHTGTCVQLSSSQTNTTLGGAALRLEFLTGVPTGQALVRGTLAETNGNGQFIAWDTIGAFPVAWGAVKNLQFFGINGRTTFPAGMRFVLRGIRR